MGHTIEISNNNAFLSLKIALFFLKNSTDPDKLLHSMALNVVKLI